MVNFQSENANLRAQCLYLDQEKTSLIANLEEEITITLEAKKEIKVTVAKLNNVQEKFESAEAKLKTLQSDKRNLESKHVTTCSELKLSKSKNEELFKEVKTTSVAIKNAKKDLKEESLRNEKVFKVCGRN